MSRTSPRGALRVGDRVRFDGQVHTVAGLAGTTVRLVDSHGAPSLMMFTHLMAAEDFELLDSQASTPGLPPFGQLDTVPEPALRKAQFFERHLIEVETGVPPDAPAGTSPRPELDPKWRTINERITAKAAELTASGTSVSDRTLHRMRLRWRDEGVWGLVDRQATRLSMPSTGRVDERLVEALIEVLASQENKSTGTRTRAMRQAEQLVAERHGEGVVPIPSRATLYRLVKALAEGRHSFEAATTRRSQARRPEAPFTPTMAARPGEVVQIDTTPLDVLAVLDDGVTGRVKLTIAVDIASRTICAAILRPTGTKAVDAALLLARILVPEPMRPGWTDALRMSASLIPHARLMSIDARLEHAAAKPVIVPDTIVVDRGKVFISDTFIAACRTLGISVQPARPATPTDKGVVERTFSSINTLFCQHIAGYVGSNVTRRGQDIEAVWTIAELADLFQEWVIACWQTRPHDGLRSPFLPGRALSPNDVYALLVSRSGHLPVCLSGDDYIELLPVEWRKINDYGITIDYRTYDCRELGPYRRQPSGVDVKGNLWEVHYDAYALSHVWVRDTRAGGWITVPWTRLGTRSRPRSPTSRGACTVAAGRAESGYHRRGRHRGGGRGSPDPGRGRPGPADRRPHPGRFRGPRPPARRGLTGDGRGDGAGRRRGGGQGHPLRGLRRLHRREPLMTHFLEPEEVDHPLTTKEGWAAFVAETVAPPVILPPATLQRLPEPERADYDRAREDYHSQLVIVSTLTIRHVAATGRKRILLNRHQHSARRGLIVSGPAGTGKTTAITQLGKNYEQLRRRRGKIQPKALPVVYVTVPPAATPKMLAIEFARFIGLPLPSRYSQIEVTNKVCDLLCTLGCRLVLIDELHNLDIGTRVGAEASDQIKYLSERIPATFVLAGVDVEGTGLFAGRRGGQIASRYSLIPTSVFRHKTADQSGSWQSLVATLEDSLRLHAHRAGTLLKLSAYLHEGVCHQHHRRLLGDGQHSLTRLPEVLRANRQHQRTLRRGTHTSTALAYVDARDRLTKCFTNKVSSPPLRQRWNRRLDVLGEDPFGDPHRPSEARIELATYPEAVILTSLSPHRAGETTHDCQPRRHNASASLPTNSRRA